MLEINPRLFVGPQEDYEDRVRHQDGWYVVHAAKEPYHRQAVGYDGPDTAPEHPEYLAARRGHRLMLNLIDAAVPVEIPAGIFDLALYFIEDGLALGSRVLMHCNQGLSRSATIALLYMASRTDALPARNADEARAMFSLVYPPFQPGVAMRHFLTIHWESYTRKWQ